MAGVVKAGPLAVAQAAQILEAGGIVVFPTETTYGLLADPRQRAAVEKVFRLKQREPQKPIPLGIPALPYIHRTDLFNTPAEEQLRLMRAFWPGPLTLVVRAGPRLSAMVTAHTGTVGVRVSSSPILQQLFACYGNALTVTSANLSGEKEARSITDLHSAFCHQADLIVDGGDLMAAKLSTVLDTTVEPFRILRPGAISEAEINRARHA